MPDYAIAGEPIPPQYATAAWFNRNQAMLAEVRAVLAPLLDQPLLGWDDGGGVYEGRHYCLFCGVAPGERLFAHEATCPVLHKDELLGRA